MFANKITRNQKKREEVRKEAGLGQKGEDLKARWAGGGWERQGRMCLHL